MAKEETTRSRGRPATGRKVTLQGGFEPEEADNIKARADERGVPLMVYLREIAMIGFKTESRKKR